MWGTGCSNHIGVRTLLCSSNKVIAGICTCIDADHNSDIATAYILWQLSVALVALSVGIRQPQ